MNTALNFENGEITTVSGTKSTSEVDYVPHKAFKGVALKALVVGDMTGNAVSEHLVKVEPFCYLDSHEHPANLEIHKVIAGSGTVEIGDKTVEYIAGSIGVIPAGTTHKVTAGKEGLYILATFTPSLV